MVWVALLVASLPQQAPPLAPSTQPDEQVGSPMTGSPQDPEAFRLEDVVVVERRGSTGLTPEREFGAAEIDALGAYDIAEVIRRLRDNLALDEFPQVIVNGRRALNPADFLGFPPDALVRVEVLPPEAGALYGDDPSRRVLNIVLQREFRSRDGSLAGSRPTAGGRSSTVVDVRQAEIHDDSTRQFGLRLGRDTALRADEREAYLRDHPASAGVTLRPSADIVVANGSMTGAIGEWAGSVNASGSLNGSRFVFRADDQLIETRQRGRDLTLTAALGGTAWGWSTQLGLDGGLSENRQSGISRVRAQALRLGANVRVDRAVMELPAGSLRTNLAGRLWSTDTETETEPDLVRRSTRSLDLNGNLFIPLARRVRGGPEGSRGLPVPGDLSLALGGAVRGLYGDGGRGEALSAGLNWAPLAKLRFDAMVSSATDSPTAAQRFDPVIYGSPQTIFDFTTGEAVEVLPLRGGNPGLGPANSRNVSIGVSAGPYSAWNLSGSLSYRKSSTTSDINSLPALTPEIEAAFPDRFIRDGDGRLTRIDQRPINLGSSRSEALSSSLNFNLPFSGPETGEAPYVQIAISHILQLASRRDLLAGLPVMDRLAGDGGGLPRHQVSVRLDGRYRNWGVNGGVNWVSGFRQRRDAGRDGPGDLVMAAFATVDVRASYQFQRPALPQAGEGAPPRAGGLRVEVEVSNLFDARPEARVGQARAPGYGVDDQDPLGRTIRVTLTRRF